MDMGEEKLSATLRDSQEHAFGYRRIRVNEPYSGYITFFGPSIKIKRGEEVYIPDSNFFISYNEDLTVSLHYHFSIENVAIEKESEEFKGFNPFGAENKYVIFDGVTQSKWEPSDQNKGMLFDSSGAGHFFHEGAYVLYNDFLIESVKPDSLQITPTMIYKCNVDDIITIKGTKYLIKSLDSDSITLAPHSL